MSDRSTASFLAGPLSPSSPAAGSLKENHQLPISSDHIPQTPTSPPLMSVSDPSHASNITSSQASPNQATTHQNTSSPSSSTPMSTQVSQQPTLSTTNSFPTPASSVSGHPVNAPSSEDSEHKSSSSETQDTSTTMEDQQGTEHRRTDHNRQKSTNTPELGARDSASKPNQRPTNDGDDDAMDVDHEPAPKAGIRNLGLDSLQDHFTSAFHICKSSPTVVGPDPSVDLISLYGLGSVAKSVARMDPVTGEKINRLRKSYEGKLKGLGLAGRNKAVKQEPGAPGSLRHLTMWPEEEWQNQKVFGKQIKIADIDSELQGLHSKAMQLEPGPVPQNDFWEDVLGHEKPTKQGSGDAGKKPAPIPGVRAAGPGHVPAPTPQEQERPRASRGRKRHYDDNSFVGYGEGYADDDDDSGLYSNGEGSGKKKRKKDHVTKVSTPISERGGSYGVGMFGIGAR